jgi:hypothetical protein
MQRRVHELAEQFRDKAVSVYKFAPVSSARQHCSKKSGRAGHIRSVQCQDVAMLALDPFVLGALAVHHVLSVLAHMRITLLSALPRRERSINADGSQRGLRSSQAAGNRARRSRRRIETSSR